MLGQNTEYQLLHQADAPSLQTTCPDADPAMPLASLCNSVDEETREAIHARLVSMLQEFFNRVMGRADASR